MKAPLIHDEEFWKQLEPAMIQSSISETFSGVGEFRFSGRLRFAGSWTGRIVSEGTESFLQILPEARISGQLEVDQISIEGHMDDVLIVARRVVVLPGARVVGSIQAKTLIVSEGAILQGRIISAPETMANPEEPLEFLELAPL